jgi:hypothetical protein
MSIKVASGIFALAVMFAATAKAEVLTDGAYSFRNGNAILNVKLTKVSTRGNDGIYEVDTNVGYLSAANSEDGTKVDATGSKGTSWVLVKNSNGWSFHHSDNGANCVSHSGDGNLKLRRSNAGGKGNADQLWQMKKL